MTTISTGSRLHFGLFNAGGVEGHPSFGGLGLMIESPRLKVTIRESPHWRSEGSESERALDAARKVALHASSKQGFSVRVDECPPLHSGLGVGTQLALAAGRAMAEELGISLEHEELARIVGRGQRSGIGVRGFHSGGFIFDHGHSGNELPHTEKIDWPKEWRILLVRPQERSAWHGSAEILAFARNRDRVRSEKTAVELRERARDVVGALKTPDLDVFGEQLYFYNRLAGEAFAVDQGGIYSSQAVQNTVEWLRAQGVRGVGQSSWGPTVFALIPADHIADFQMAASAAFEGKSVVEATHGANNGFIQE